MPRFSRSSLLLPSCALLFAVASIGATGYGAFVGNHAIQIPLVHILQDPSLYPGDPFVDTLRDYPVALWRIIALLADWMPVRAILLGGFLLTRLLAVASAGILASVLAPRSRLAILCAMAFMAMAPRPVLGGGTIMPPIFEQTGLAVPIYLMAFAAFLTKWRYTFALLLAFAAYLNIMYGIFFAAYLGFLVLFNLSFFREWRRWIAPLGLLFLLTAPLAIQTLHALHPEPYDREVWLAVNLVRAKHHMDPLTFRPEQWLRMCLLLVLAGCAAAQCRKLNPPMARLAIAASFACIFWIGLGMAARFLQSPSLLTLHSFRGTDFFYCLAGILAAALAGTRLQGQTQEPMGWILVPLACATLLQPWHGFALPALFAAVTGASLVWRSKSPAQWRWAVPILVLLAVLWAAFRTGLRDGEFLSRPDRDLEKIAEWARKETGQASAFLIHPNWNEFRILSLRPVYVAWKDGGALPWSRSYAAIWLERFESLGITLEDLRDHSDDLDNLMDRRYEHLDVAAAQAIARKAHVDYWILEKGHEVMLPTVFETNDWKAVAFRDPARGVLQ